MWGRGNGGCGRVLLYFGLIILLFMYYLLWVGDGAKWLERRKTAKELEGKSGNEGDIERSGIGKNRGRVLD